MEEAEVERWFAEHRRLDAELRVFRDRVRRKQDEVGHWIETPTAAEEAFDELEYFYNAALVNNGAIFTYLEFMIPRRQQLEAIGAKGCLAAMDALMPFYKEQSALGSDKERQDYLLRTRSARKPAEMLVEDPNVFAQLMIDYARREIRE